MVLSPVSGKITRCSVVLMFFTASVSLVLFVFMTPLLFSGCHGSVVLFCTVLL